MDRGAATSVRDLESNNSSYAPLPGGGDDAIDNNHVDDGSTWSNTRVLALTLATALLLVLGAALLHVHGGDGNVNLNAAINVHPDLEGVTPRRPRGVEEGVSNKESGVRWAENESENALKAAGTVSSYGWTKDELRWQRTGFHFQPPKNWMNGPLYYKGWYHLFYQYNPDSAVWGNITWGHAVSGDLINWRHLPPAMVPDHWYDANGAWTGSATILPDGRVVMLYTGSTNESVQVQNLAFPADLSDPLLLDWVKSESNPVLFPPAGIDDKDFRDPTTAWYEPSESAWRIAIGSKNADGAGISLVYRTTDFMKYTLLPELLHVVPGTGMWECVDFYPVSKAKEVGLDTSMNGPEVKHVFKASLDDDRNDYYAIGTYDPVGGKWTPDDPGVDLGIGARYDYGRFYAAKSFYDQDKQRRVIWGWIGEADSERADIAKGWASLMAIPRTVRLDEKTGSNLLQWPVEEVERLRTARTTYSDVEIAAGSVVPLDVGKANQLDINVEFEISKEALKAAMEANVTYNCSTSAGAAGRGVLGPFGLLVLADEGRTEQTAVYFYVAKAAVGKLGTFICHDEMRSSKADDTEKKLQGSIVPVLDGENLSLRILVDHSIVETFAQGGRTCITSRVYPTSGIHQAARIFVFNNATDASVTAKSVDVWDMNSAFLRPYSSAQGK